MAKTIVNTDAVAYAKSVLLSKIADLQTAFDLLSDYNISVVEMGDLSEKTKEQLKIILVKKTLGGSAPTVGGVALSEELFEKYSVIDNLDEIYNALRVVDERTRPLLRYLIVDDNDELSIDESTIESDNTMTANAKQTAIIAVAEAVVSAVGGYEQQTGKVLKCDLSDLEQLLTYSNGQTAVNYSYILRHNF